MSELTEPTEAEKPAESETSRKRAVEVVGLEVRRSPACVWSSVRLVDRRSGWLLGGQTDCGYWAQKKKPSRKVALRHSGERSPKTSPTP
ncbi:hypothetical protein NDU88_002899 [Pleurodeles waltl]|uniref:Uncharacterized protein n=1 Tax=Pleurodeles waltl TaxID=8319 RepID=A0AAV7M2E2_PLEWA|nr:hypothetical protein NDU88_002899 [Pleurodeles waltl]